jgi:hypothetical protein
MRNRQREYSREQKQFLHGFSLKGGGCSMGLFYGVGSTAKGGGANRSKKAPPFAMPTTRRSSALAAPPPPPTEEDQFEELLALEEGLHNEADAAL